MIDANYLDKDPQPTVIILKICPNVRLIIRLGHIVIKPAPSLLGC